MRPAFRLLAAVALGLPAISQAAPSDYVYVPAVEYGEHEIDFKYGTAKLKGSEGGGRLSSGALGYGFGVTEWMFIEAYPIFEKGPGERTKYDAFELEGKFQLTEPNQYFVDLGLIAEVEVPRAPAVEGYEFKWGPLFQFDTGELRWNANLLFERHLRSRDEGPQSEMGYQLQVKYPWRREIEFGAQALGELGRWNHWDPREEQTHRAGPAIFGKLKLEGRRAIRYNAAWLFGANAAPRNTFRLQAEYEF